MDFFDRIHKICGLLVLVLSILQILSEKAVVLTDFGLLPSTMMERM
jgi:hypothetical protein